MSLALVLVPAAPRPASRSYGAAELKRLQPAYFRNALALSCAGAMLCSIVLHLLLQSTPNVPLGNVVIIDPPPPPQGPKVVPPPTDLPKVVVPNQPTDPGQVLPTVEPDTLVTPEKPIFSSPLETGGIVSIDARPNGGGEGGEVETLPGPKDFVPHEDDPVAVSRPAPPYPELARQAGIEGQLVLNVLVDRQGRVREVLVVRSVEVFEDVSIQAVRRWVFRPALSNGHPVAVWVTIPIRFTLH